MKGTERLNTVFTLPPATVGEQEAVRVSYEQSLAELQGKVKELTLQVNRLQGERDNAMSSQKTSAEQLRERIKILEKVV